MNLLKLNGRRSTAWISVLTAGVVAAVGTVHAQDTDTVSSPRDTLSAQSARESGAAAAALKEMAKLNVTTIKFAEVAVERAHNPELKRFGELLQSHHKKAQTRLQALAEKRNVTLPTALDPKYGQQMNKLRQLSGSAFDREYTKGAVEGYATALAQLKDQDPANVDPEVAQYTKEIQAQMRDDLRNARELAKAVGLDPETILALEAALNPGVGTAGAASETSIGRGAAENPDQPPRGDQPK
jgi:putative membrane protein